MCALCPDSANRCLHKHMVPAAANYIAILRYYSFASDTFMRKNPLRIFAIVQRQHIHTNYIHMTNIFSIVNRPMVSYARTLIGRSEVVIVLPQRKSTLRISIRLM